LSTTEMICSLINIMIVYRSETKYNQVEFKLKVKSGHIHLVGLSNLSITHSPVQMNKDINL
jgi:hypothetical protein